MKRKLIICAVVAAILLCGIAGGLIYKNWIGQVQILDRTGQPLQTMDRISVTDADEWSQENRAYLQIALEEAAAIVADIEGCDVKTAKTLLTTGNYKIYTAFDPAIQQALADTYQEYARNALQFGSAVTDLEGHLIAAYSGGGEGSYKNYATTRTAPYSSFKPISVYAPALEKGIIHYSKTYLDGPVKKLEAEDGVLRDWPANATNTYSNAPVPIAEGVRVSLNTIAVRCMAELGLSESFRFMKDSFGLSLTFEEERAAQLGEEEVYGNVALGYLEDGVSPVEMAGYYQVFANGGLYTAPKTVLKICDRSGREIYTFQPESKRVLEEGNATIMNRILREVTSAGGTGAAAGNLPFAVAGKTGTGARGNWFAGITPEYSCVIWHGKQTMSNNAARIFQSCVSKFPAHSVTEFAVYGNVTEAVFCTESGNIICDQCKKVRLGVYLPDNMPDKCDMHE